MKACHSILAAGLIALGLAACSATGAGPHDMQGHDTAGTPPGAGSGSRAGAGVGDATGIGAQGTSDGSTTGSGAPTAGAGAR